MLFLAQLQVLTKDLVPQADHEIKVNKTAANVVDTFAVSSAGALPTVDCRIKVVIAIDWNANPTGRKHARYGNVWLQTRPCS